MSTNKCPHPQCDVQKPVNQYSCKPHWFSLPKEIRDKIWKGFKGDATLWLDADKEAIDFWTAKIKRAEATK